MRLLQLVREHGRAYRLLFARICYIQHLSKKTSSHTSSDNLTNCDDCSLHILTMFSALVAVRTAYCATNCLTLYLSYYRQEARSATCRYCFYSRADFLGGFRPAGATRCTDQGEIWQVGADHRRSAPICQISCTLIGSGVWVYGPQNYENFEFYTAPKGQVSCTILTKFTGFMLVLNLHNAAKFGCFSSTINGKIINNLPWWGIFSQIYDDP